MLTRGKGDDLSLKTRWVGSIYDSSYYYNPYMEPYRRAGRMKFPFFLTPDKHYVGSAWYRRSVTIPARPFLGLDDEGETEVIDLIDEFIRTKVFPK